ncbi:lysylphosphatidylglycerol synthase domain-containing protein [Neoroseomonas soli]|uniref:Flippase-like domain-containing protein n=1 Tax=Neoroseomonas soli TaxID=1081025 RepID=A0A9X9X4L9_9PROT|nr:flippase-like domain-containing protein [Neoroseomonas soli]
MRQTKLISLSIILSFLLIVLLIFLSGADVDLIKDFINRVPASVFFAVAGIEFIGLLAGAQKWRIAMVWSRPDAGYPPILSSLEASTLGSLFAQVLPAQFAMVFARALLQRRHAGVGAAVWATFHEQLFDLLALGAVGAAVASAFILRTDAVSAVSTGAVVALGGVLGVRALFKFAESTARRLLTKAPQRLLPSCGSVQAALADAARLPWRVAAAMTVLSMARVACWTARAIVSFAVLLPNAPLFAIATAIPLVQLATVLPIIPGGVGTVEWIWTGALAATGIPPSDAAAAALATRAIQLGGFLLVLGTVGVLAIANRWRSST